jgi:hypothetical protein
MDAVADDLPQRIAGGAVFSAALFQWLRNGRGGTAAAHISRLIALALRQAPAACMTAAGMGSLQFFTTHPEAVFTLRKIF